MVYNQLTIKNILRYSIVMQVASYCIILTLPLQMLLFKVGKLDSSNSTKASKVCHQMCIAGYVVIYLNCSYIYISISTWVFRRTNSLVGVMFCQLNILAIFYYMQLNDGYLSVKRPSLLSSYHSVATVFLYLHSKSVLKSQMHYI